MTKAVGVIIDGAVEWHAAGVAMDYATLCGIDPNDPSIGHDGEMQPARGQKITCDQCRAMWRNTIALRLRESDFSKGKA